MEDTLPKSKKTFFLPKYSTCICISSSVAKWGRQGRRDGRKEGEEKEEKEERRAQKPKTETQNGLAPRPPPSHSLRKSLEHGIPNVCLEVGTIVLVEALSRTCIVAAYFERLAHA